MPVRYSEITPSGFTPSSSGIDLGGMASSRRSSKSESISESLSRSFSVEFGGRNGNGISASWLEF
jgi:hypothetical protein